MLGWEHLYFAMLLMNGCSVNATSGNTESCFVLIVCKYVSGVSDWQAVGVLVRMSLMYCLWCGYEESNALSVQ